MNDPPGRAKSYRGGEEKLLGGHSKGESYFLEGKEEGKRRDIRVYNSPFPSLFLLVCTYVYKTRCFF